MVVTTSTIEFLQLKGSNDGHFFINWNLSKETRCVRPTREERGGGSPMKGDEKRQGKTVKRVPLALNRSPT